MADSLIDLGQVAGTTVKMVNPQSLIPKSETPDLKDVLGTVNLVQQIQDRPLQRQKTEQDIEKGKRDLQLLDNEVANIEMSNFKKRKELDFLLADEERKRREHIVNQIIQIPKVMNIDPVLGASIIESNFPGFKVVPEGKAFKAVGPGTGGKQAEFLIDPNRIVEPEKRLQFENTERQNFVTESKNFDLRASAFRSAMSLKDLKTGAADLSLVVNYIRMNDPGNAVKEGEVLTAQNTPSLSSQLVNRYNKAVKEGGPLFSPKERENFIDAMRVQMKSYTADQLAKGRYSMNLANARGLNPMGVVAPIGGLLPEDYLPPEQMTPEQRKAAVERLQALGMGK